MGEARPFIGEVEITSPILAYGACEDAVAAGLEIQRNVGRIELRSIGGLNPGRMQRRDGVDIAQIPYAGL